MKLQLTAFLGLFLQSTSALSAPAAGHQSHCTNHPIFTLHNINYSDSTIYSTPAHLAVADASIQFNLTNTAVSYTTECSAYVGDWAWPTFFWGNVTYNCKVYMGVGAEQASTNFTFSRNGEIRINSIWRCGQGDNEKSFLGVGSGVVNLYCNTTSWTNSSANWTVGELWSTQSTTCLPVNLDISPTFSHSGVK